MRPIKLTMSAFGPYSGEVVVDFASLGSTGLYLVCGDTGAGKTTIFDAVSFALFGSPSGQDRTVRSLRSDFASAATPTFVELEFEHRCQRYTIRRNPEYERPKLRGDGLTTQTADAELRMPDAAPITGTRDVDAAILELIGIDRSQFSQIVMIAQGDFRRLLSAGTKERAAILRKLFGTAPYDEFQKALKRRRDKLEDDSKTVRNRLLALAPMISISDEAEEGGDAGDAATSTRRERRDALGASEAPDAEDMLALIAEQDAADEAILGALAGEASAAAARVETLTTLSERAGQVRAAKASLEETVSKLGIACEGVEAAKAELDECSKTEPRRKELAKRRRGFAMPRGTCMRRRVVLGPCNPSLWRLARRRPISLRLPRSLLRLRRTKKLLLKASGMQKKLLPDARSSRDARMPWLSSRRLRNRPRSTAPLWMRLPGQR